MATFTQITLRNLNIGKSRLLHAELPQIEKILPLTTAFFRDD